MYHHHYRLPLLPTLILFLTIFLNVSNSSPSQPPLLNSTSSNPIPINSNAPKTVKPTTKTFPPLPSLQDKPDGTSVANFTTSSFDLDGPKLSEITPSTFDWWYFDAVSTKNPNVSVVFTFFSASQIAFPWLLAGADQTGISALSAYMWVTFGNGSVSTKVVPAKLATVVSGGYGSSGNWEGSGFDWSGTEDAGSWVITVDRNDLGVNGSMVIDSPGTELSLELSPEVGWVNVVPDGNGTVSLDVDGESIEFQGPAYHDKNWSTRPFFSTVSSWYWGHGYIGPYSIVWFNSITANNSTHVSSYIAKDGKVLLSTCNSKSITVRPTGESDDEKGVNGMEQEGRYPPHAGDYPAGFRIVADLGPDEGIMRVNVTARAVLVSDARYYVRWTGMMDGVVEGGSHGNAGEIYRGVGVYEQFVLDES